MDSATAAPAPVSTAQRHHFVDALRGFALLGILVVNIEFIVQPASVAWSEYTSTLDQVVRWFVISFGQAKVYPIFATLFGYGLSLQFQRATGSKAASLQSRTRRRNAALFVLGVAHGILFFPGDILTIYAIVGALCFRFRHWPTDKLVKLAAWVYGIASVFWVLLGMLDALGGGSTMFSAADPADVEALTNGSFIDVIGVHIPSWIETSIFLFVIQGPAVVASYAIGIALARTDLLSDPGKHHALVRRQLGRFAPIALVVAGFAGWLSLSDIRFETLGFALGFAIAPLVSATYIGILSLTIGARRNVVARVLQMAGSMSLTVYLLESVVATTLAYGYGFGLFGRVGPAAGVGLAVAIWLGLALAARVWMSQFRFGPFEWLLRSITYGKRQPLRAAAAS